MITEEQLQAATQRPDQGPGEGTGKAAHGHEAGTERAVASVKGEVEAVMSRIVTNFKPAPPERIESKKRLEHERKVARFREKWKAPERQLNLKEGDTDRTGKWAETEHKLLARLGTGFLIALIGTRGGGKTQLGVQLMKATTARLKTALYCSVTEFFMEIKATYKPDNFKTELDVIKEFRRPALLVLDEAGRRGETDWEDRLLFELLDKRYQDCKDTLLISNQTEIEFHQSIGPSLASRMLETGGIITCDWESFRSRQNHRPGHQPQ